MEPATQGDYPQPGAETLLICLLVERIGKAPRSEGGWQRGPGYPGLEPVLSSLTPGRTGLTPEEKTVILPTCTQSIRTMPSLSLAPSTI